MIFRPQNLIQAEGSFTFSGDIQASAHPCLDKDIIKEFWHNFTYRCSALSICHSDEFIFSIGNTKPLPLDGNDYSIHIEEDGICVYAEDEKSLLCGFMTLLDRFVAIDVDDKLAIDVPCCTIQERPLIQNRMVHFCIFPETEIWELQRFVRFCGALKYTHIILEFWGMLRYDCMGELAWSHAFEKEQIRPIIREANDLGLEVIPMFNHWGHASAGRVMHGKHVVLDQNPTLQTYFSDDGWCWDIRKPKVRALMRQIRAELVELCGDGQYFHIGCDEAYNFELTKENMDFICDYINEISDEMAAVNRRVIVWGDMFLYNHPHYNPKNYYTCNAPSPEAEQYLLARLHRDVIVADWQYDSAHAPVETSAVFTKAGFECLLCPSDVGKGQMNAVLSTIKTQNLKGLLHTTWNTLSVGLPFVTMAAIGCFENDDLHTRRPETAALLRKVMPTGGIYERAGWSKFEVSYKW